MKENDFVLLKCFVCQKWLKIEAFWSHLKSCTKNSASQIEESRIENVTLKYGHLTLGPFKTKNEDEVKNISVLFKDKIKCQRFFDLHGGKFDQNFTPLIDAKINRMIAELNNQKLRMENRFYDELSALLEADENEKLQIEVDSLATKVDKCIENLENFLTETNKICKRELRVQ